jgi:hypothetical protein
MCHGRQPESYVKKLSGVGLWNSETLGRRLCLPLLPEAGSRDRLQ